MNVLYFIFLESRHALTPGYQFHVVVHLVTSIMSLAKKSKVQLVDFCFC